MAEAGAQAAGGGQAEAAAVAEARQEAEVSVARLPPWKGNGKDATTIDL